MTNVFPISAEYKDVFKHSALKEANIIDLIKEIIHPKPRIFDCLQIEVTSFCSAKCTYCPHTTKADKWKSQHMKAHTFANLWPLLQQSTRVHLQGWGEPFLNPHFFEFVALARKAGCLVSSTSCGLHLNEDICKKIIKSGMDIVAFSLAGTDKESNSPRKNADFDKVYQGIKLLQKMRKQKMAVHLEIHLAYIMLADRLEAVSKLPELMKDLDIHASIVSTLDYLAAPEQEKLTISAKDTEIIEKSIKILQEAAQRASENEQKIYYALPSFTPSPECRENVQKSLYIDAAGVISPCIYLNVPYDDEEENKRRIVFGNANEENILDIWNKEEFVDFRKGHQEGNVKSMCKTCVKRFEALY